MARNVIELIISAVDNATGVLRGVENSVNQIDGSSKRASGGVRAMNVALSAAAGVAATAATTLAAAAAAGFDAARQSEQAQKMMQAQLGVTADEAQRLGKIAEDVFGNNWGASVGEAADALVQVRQQITGMASATDEQMQLATEAVFALRDAFGVELAESTNSANALIENFGLTSTEAFDLMTAGFQEGLNTSDDFLESISEYSNVFADAGFSAEQMYNIMRTGAEAGVLGTDKIADALKEMSVKLVEGKDELQFSFDAMGISYENMRESVASGQATWADYFDEIVAGINGLDSPIDRANAQVAIFGTMAEDLGVSFTEGLSTAGTALTDFEGATVRAGDTVNEELGARVQAIVRTFSVEFMRAMQPLLPVVHKLLDVVEQNIPAIVNTIKTGFDVVAQVVDFVRGAVDKFRNQWNDSLEDSNSTASRIVQSLRSLWQSLRDAATATFTMLVNLWQNVLKPAWENMQPYVEGLFNGVLVILRTAFEAIAGIMEWLSQLMNGDFAGAWETMRDTIIDIVTGLGEGVGSILTGLGQMALRWGADIVMGLVNGIRNSLANARETVENFANNVSGWFRNALGIRSPSLEFEADGFNSVQGYIEGWRKNEENALAQVEEFAEAIKQLGYETVEGFVEAFESQTPEAIAAAEELTGGITGALYALDETKSWVARLTQEINLGFKSSADIIPMLSTRADELHAELEQLYEQGRSGTQVWDLVNAKLTILRDTVDGLAKTIPTMTEQLQAQMDDLELRVNMNQTEDMIRAAIDEISPDLAQVTAEVNRMLAEGMTLSDAPLAVAVQQLNILQKTYEGLATKLEDFANPTALEQLQTRLDTLQMNIDTNGAEANLRAILSDIEPELVALRERVATFASAGATVADPVVADANSRLRLLSNFYQGLVEQIEGFDVTPLERLTSTVDGLKLDVQLDAGFDNLSRVSNEIEQRLRTVTAQVDNWRRQGVGMQDAALQDANQRMQLLSNFYDDLQKKMDGFAVSPVEALEARINGLKLDVQIDASLSNVQSIAESIRPDLDAVTSQIEDWRRQGVSASEPLMEQAAQELELLSDFYDDLRKQIEALDTTITPLEQTLNRINGLSVDIDTAGATTEAVQRAFDAIKPELEDVRSQLQQWRSAGVDASDDTFQQWAKRFDKLNDFATKLQKQLDAAVVSPVEALETRLDTFQASLNLDGATENIDRISAIVKPDMERVATELQGLLDAGLTISDERVDELEQQMRLYRKFSDELTKFTDTAREQRELLEQEEEDYHRRRGQRLAENFQRRRQEEEEARQRAEEARARRAERHEEDLEEEEARQTRERELLARSLELQAQLREQARKRAIELRNERAAQREQEVEQEEQAYSESYQNYMEYLERKREAQYRYAEFTTAPEGQSSAKQPALPAIGPLTPEQARANPNDPRVTGMTEAYARLSELSKIAVDNLKIFDAEWGTALDSISRATLTFIDMLEDGEFRATDAFRAIGMASHAMANVVEGSVSDSLNFIGQLANSAANIIMKFASGDVVGGILGVVGAGVGIGLHITQQQEMEQRKRERAARVQQEQSQLGSTGSGYKSGTQVNFGGVSTGQQLAVQTPIVDAANKMMQAAEMMIEFLKNSSLGGTNQNYAEIILQHATAMQAHTLALQTSSIVLNRLVDEGISVNNIAQPQADKSPKMLPLAAIRGV